MDPDTQRTAATTLRPTSRPPTQGVPGVTWVISGATVVVMLAAGALVWGKKETVVVPPDAEDLELESDLSEANSAPTPLTTRGPLDLSAWHLDAQQRAHIWNEAAMLSGVRLLIENGAPIAAVEFEFGDSMGQTTPGAALGAPSYIVAYNGAEVATKAENSSKRRVAMSPPNCTLDAAYRVLIQAGVPRDSRVGVMLLHSEKHRRPVWLMTTSEGSAYNVDAESCVLLRR